MPSRRVFDLLMERATGHTRRGRAAVRTTLARQLAPLCQVHSLLPMAADRTAHEERQPGFQASRDPAGDRDALPPAIAPLHALANALGVHTSYTDGLGRSVTVSAETLVRVCAAMGSSIERPGDAADALRELQVKREGDVLPPVVVAWDGALPPIPVGMGAVRATLSLEDGGELPLQRSGAGLAVAEPLPMGYHRLTVDLEGGGSAACTVISAPVHAWQRPGAHRAWGVGTHLAALRSRRSRSLGDLQDLQALCRWVRGQGGDLVTVLPLLPTFNSSPAEPSPYSPVSRLFWSELVLDLGEAHRPVPPPATLDVTRADAEIRAALVGVPLPAAAAMDEELVRYARFRGAQARLGRNWRDWPATARDGTLAPGQVDADEERFHLVAQELMRRQMRDARQGLDREGVRLGLDLAVGVHPDGYDQWSRQSLFGVGMSVGAPPDPGFPSGQDWGFAPVLPGVSRLEGHRYLARSIAHQATLAGLLRIDHIMAWARLYWIPHGMGLHEGTYVSYPSEELFAVLTLESQRHRCEIVGENLGTVPPVIHEALPRHRIKGMYLAQFEAAARADVALPTSADVALIGTHDTPTFAGWLAGDDIADRVGHGLLAASDAPGARAERATAADALAARLGGSVAEPEDLLGRLLEWMGRSDSALVVPWLEDLWLEEHGVNLPGTPSSERANWQRPMGRLLDEVVTDERVERLVRRLDRARSATASPALSPGAG